MAANLERERAKSRERQRQRRETTPEKAHAATLKWRAANPDQYRASKAKSERKGQRLRLYGLDDQTYQQMLAEQNGRCAICDKTFAGTRDTHVDHCHSTGRVRALLCGRCNPGLGCFDDDIARLQRAIDYLERFAK